MNLHVHSFTWNPLRVIGTSHTPHRTINDRTTKYQTRLFAGGFGAKKNPKPKKMNPSQARKAAQQLVDRYGGDIQKGTQSRIDAALASLPPHVREAATLYKEWTQFDALVSPMNDEDRNRLIPPEQWEISSRDRSKLDELMKEHSLTENDLHNIYQRITWDASADAKATRADIAGNKMKGDLQERITRACSLAVEAVGRANAEGRKGKLLDIGCGHGSIVPSLDLPDLDSYVGIDLSEEMIKNAVERYGHEKNKHGRGRVFVADDFLTHDFSVYAEDNSSSKDSTEVFDAVIFCSSLHDLPDMENCIGRAASLLLPGGKLIVVHAQGAMVCNVVSFQRTLCRFTH
jgi:SAM-dependent methyltransferase